MINFILAFMRYVLIYFLFLICIFYNNKHALIKVLDILYETEEGFAVPEGEEGPPLPDEEY